VHKARVASRRVREALPVLLAEAPARRRRRLRKQAERITRALGPVRELDVSMAVIDELAAQLGAHDPGLTAVRREIDAERRPRRQRLSGRLRGVDGRRLRARGDRYLAEALRASAAFELSAAAVLLIRLTRRVDELEAAVEAAGPLYGAEPIHNVRIATKKLRYAFELAHDLKLLRSRRVLTRLRAMQQTLGRLNDLQVLVRRAEALRARARRLDGEALTTLIATLEARCRERHARYLAGRERLLVDADAALAETALQAAGAGEPPVARPVLE
jgi:CHAD domain-containing protein